MSRCECFARVGKYKSLTGIQVRFEILSRTARNRRFYCFDAGLALACKNLAATIGGEGDRDRRRNHDHERQRNYDCDSWQISDRDSAAIADDPRRIRDCDSTAIAIADDLRSILPRLWMIPDWFLGYRGWSAIDSSVIADDLRSILPWLQMIHDSAAIVDHPRSIPQRSRMIRD